MKQSWLIRLQKGLEFEISTDKKEYYSGEPIIVASQILNTSAKSLLVKQPVATAFVVTFTLETINGEERGPVVRQAIGDGVPLWTAPVVELQPHGSSFSDCELSRQLGPEDFKPGSYALQASYHLSNYDAHDYRTNVLTSREVYFNVKPLSNDEKKMKMRLSQSLHSAERNTEGPNTGIFFGKASCFHPSRLCITKIV